MNASCACFMPCLFMRYLFMRHLLIRHLRLIVVLMVAGFSGAILAQPMSPAPAGMAPSSIPPSGSPSSNLSPSSTAGAANPTEQLKNAMADIIEPNAVGMWPLAWGWWLVIVAVTLVIVGLIFWAVVRYRNNLYRRQALKLLAAEEFDNLHAQAQFLMKLSKQVALKAYPNSRGTIAKSFGPDWLNWLNGTTSKPMFNKKLARQWQEQLYTTTNEPASSDLSKLIRHWIKRHHRGREVLRDV